MKWRVRWAVRDRVTNVPATGLANDQRPKTNDQRRSLPCITLKPDAAPSPPSPPLAGWHRPAAHNGCGRDVFLRAFAGHERFESDSWQDRYRDQQDSQRISNFQ